MEYRDWITIAAIVIGPALAVALTLFIESRRIKRRERMFVFMRLWRMRGMYPMPEEFVDALNEIDVVFHGNDRIIDLWRSVHDASMIEPFNALAQERFNTRLLDLLHEMGRFLDYEIRQTTIGRAYRPEQFRIAHQMQSEIANETLRALRNSEHFGGPRMEQTETPDS